MESLKTVFRLLARMDRAEEAFHLHRKVVAMEQELSGLECPAAANEDGAGGDPGRRTTQLRASIAEKKAQIAALFDDDAAVPTAAERRPLP